MMRFGLCASFREIALLSTREFDFLEENIQRFLVPEQPQEVFLEHLQEVHKLSITLEAANAFFPADLPLIETPTRRVDSPRIERYVRTALQRAEQAGMRVLVFGSGAARACPADYDRQAALRQLREHLAYWCEWARDYGVTIVLEPLRREETNLLNTVEESGTFIEPIANRGARLLADLYHMACNGEEPDSLAPWASLLAHVHLAQQAERAAPTPQGEDFRPALAVLQKAGYQQRLSIECRWSNVVAEANTAIATVREQWESAALS